MNTKLERWKEEKFLRYFLRKEKQFLINFNNIFFIGILKIHIEAQHALRLFIIYSKTLKK